MIKERLNDLGMSIALIAASIVFLPKLQSFWMSSMFMPTVLCAFSLLVIAFIAVSWKEQALDEREELHRAKAGRIAYIATVLTLTLGIIIQTANETLDPWLIITLLIMILSKLLARMYFEKTE